jgi:glyoxylase-like metal-dependent hydrolase (beta-lactamase superfamily II)
MMATCKDHLDVEVVLVRPEDAAEHWEQTALARTVAAIPTVRVTVDAGGAMARRFGARTSGHAVLYDPAGKLVFTGGITGSRGHEGDNPGSEAVASAVLSPSTPHVDTTRVYGCALATPTAALPTPFTEHAK